MKNDQLFPLPMLLRWIGKTIALWGRRKRQITANILSCIMILSMLPIGDIKVLAAGEVCRIGSTGYADLQSAFNAVKEGEVIVMQSNVTITDGARYETKNAVNFTLDLNGKTINGGSGDWSFIMHSVAGTLTIQDSSSGSNGKITSKRSKFNYATVTTNSSSNANLILKSGTIENTYPITDAGDAGYAIINAGGTLRIEGGKVYGTSAAIAKRGGGNMTLSGGVIEGGLYGIDTYGGSSTITITGGSPVIKGTLKAVSLIQIFTYSNAKILASKTSTNGSALEEVKYSDLESYDISNKIEIYKYITTEPVTRVTLKQGESGTETAYYDFPKAWKEALAFADQSSTREHQAILTLQQDITGVSVLSAFKKGYITLDTNGKRLSFGSSGSTNPWEDIDIDGGELSIIGSGTVEGTSNHSTIYINSGILNLTDATIRNTGGTNFTIRNGGFSGNGPGVFNMYSGTIENVTGLTPLYAAGTVSNIYSGTMIGPARTTSYTKFNLFPEAGKTIVFRPNQNYTGSGLFGTGIINGKGTVIIESISGVSRYFGISNGEPTSNTRLRFIDGTLIVDNSKSQGSADNGAFTNIPDFDANGYYKVTAGADATTASVVLNPTAATFTQNKYVKIETPNEYDITLHENGGTYVAGYQKPISYNKGDEVVLPTSEQISKEGYTFLGWTETDSPDDTNYVTAIPTTAVGPKTYYAKWETRKYKLTINYISTNGSPVSTPYVEDIEYGKTYSVKSPAITGYTVDQASVSGTMGMSDVTVDVKYTPNTYNVTFYLSGGSWNNYTSPDTYTYGIGLTLPTQEHVVRSGYQFLGWVISGDDIITSIAPNDIGNKSFSARWLDITPPTGSIQIRTKTFNKLLNTITFGLFFKNTQSVTIYGNDNSYLSTNIAYALSETEITDFDSVSWIPYTDPFSLDPNQKVIVYAKITDRADNSIIINSDGLVLFTDSEAITTEVSFTKTSADDVTATVNLNGNTIKEVRLNGNTLTKDTHYTVSDNTISLKADYLNTLAAGDYTVVVSYYPFGETETPKAGSDSPATTAFALHISNMVPTISIAASPTGSQVRPNSVTLSATLPAGATGTLQFKANGENIGAPVPVGQTVTFTASGTVNNYTFTVVYSGDGNYAGATSEPLSYSFEKGEQAVLSFEEGTPTEKTYGDAPFTVTATGGSGTGAVTYSIVSGPATIDGNNVTLTGAGTVLIRAVKAADDDYNETSAETSINVEKKPVTITGLSAQNKTYDGTAAATISGTAVLDGKVDGDHVDIVHGTATFTDKTVGNGKTVTFTGYALDGDDADKYTLTAQPAAVTADIASKAITATVTIQDKAYDGLDTATIEGASLNDVVDEDTVHLASPYPAATFDSVGVGDNIPVSFSGNFELTGDDADNYTLTQPSVTGNIFNDYHAARDVDYAVNRTGWGNTDFIVTAQPGFKLSLTNTADGEWTDTLTRSDETNDDSLTFYVKNLETGAISLAVSESYKIDKTAPTGDITIGESSIKKVLNTITFGLFFKDTQSITIASEDEASGVASVLYQLSDTVLEEDAVMESSDWTPYTGTITLEPGSKKIVYAKITDLAGNVLYIGSDGLVIDNTAPVITGIENDNVYCAAVTVTVSDENLDIVTVDGMEITLTDGQLTLAPTGTPQTIVATDKAGNSRTVTVTIYDGHAWDEGVVTKAPTAAEEGVKTYTCTHCGETRTEAIDKLPPTIIEGSNSQWIPGEGQTLTFRSDSAFSDFIGVLIDGEAIDAKNYDVKEGSIIVTLKAEYLATLSPGKHTIGIQSTTGIATTEFTILAKEDDKAPSKPGDKPQTGGIPQTGDYSHMGLWLVLLLVSVGMIILLGIKSRKKNVMK